MTTTQLPGREVFTPEEAADYLAIGRTSFYTLMRRGEIESIKIGRLRRIRKAALDRYLDELAEEQA